MTTDKKERPARRWLLLLPLIAVAVGLALVVGIWLVSRGGGEAPIARQPAPPVAPEPASPPAAWKPELALVEDKRATSAASLDPTVQQIPAAVSLLAAKIEKIPADRAAPASLLILPGDVRTFESISRFPRHERWEIQFSPGSTIDSYSRQLDFFKIELGVIGEGDKVSYLANLSAPTPAIRTAPAADDQRLYLVWQRGAMREAAQELAIRAKLDPRGKVLAHFCPSELETQLAQLEDEFARQKGFRKIRKTIFGIRPSDSGGYSCYVIDQKADDS